MISVCRRYKLLLETLIKHTGEKHHDLKNLKDALNLVCAAASHNDKAIEKQQMAAKIMDIQKLFDPHGTTPVPPLMDSPLRRFIREGTLTVKRTREGKLKQRNIWLFNDMILLARPDMLGGTFTLKAVAELDDCTITRGIEPVAWVDESIDRTFTLLKPGLDPWYLWAKSVPERDQWFNDISAAIEEAKTLTGRKATERKLSSSPIPEGAISFVKSLMSSPTALPIPPKNTASTTASGVQASLSPSPPPPPPTTTNITATLSESISISSSPSATSPLGTSLIEEPTAKASSTTTTTTYAGGREVGHISTQAGINLSKFFTQRMAAHTTAASSENHASNSTAADVKRLRAMVTAQDRVAADRLALANRILGMNSLRTQLGSDQRSQRFQDSLQRLLQEEFVVRKQREAELSFAPEIEQLCKALEFSFLRESLAVDSLLELLILSAARGASVDRRYARETLELRAIVTDFSSIKIAQPVSQPPPPPPPPSVSFSTNLILTATNTTCHEVPLSPNPTTAGKLKAFRAVSDPAPIKPPKQPRLLKSAPPKPPKKMEGESGVNNSTRPHGLTPRPKSSPRPPSATAAPDYHKQVTFNSQPPSESAIQARIDRMSSRLNEVLHSSGRETAAIRQSSSADHAHNLTVKKGPRDSRYNATGAGDLHSTAGSARMTTTSKNTPTIKGFSRTTTGLPRSSKLDNAHGRLSTTERRERTNERLGRAKGGGPLQPSRQVTASAGGTRSRVTNGSRTMG